MLQIFERRRTNRQKRYGQIIFANIERQFENGVWQAAQNPTKIEAIGSNQKQSRPKNVTRRAAIVNLAITNNFCDLEIVILRRFRAIVSGKVNAANPTNGFAAGKDFFKAI